MRIRSVCLPSDCGQKGHGGCVLRFFGVLEFGQPYTVEAEVIGHHKLIDKVAVAIGQCAAPISIGLDSSGNGDAHARSRLCLVVQKTLTDGRRSRGWVENSAWRYSPRAALSKRV